MLRSRRCAPRPGASASPSIVSRSLIKKHSRYGEPPPRFLVPVLSFIFPPTSLLLWVPGFNPFSAPSPLLVRGLAEGQGPREVASGTLVGLGCGWLAREKSKTGRETYRVVIDPAPHHHHPPIQLLEVVFKLSPAPTGLPFQIARDTRLGCTFVSNSNVEQPRRS